MNDKIVANELKKIAKMLVSDESPMVQYRNVKVLNRHRIYLEDLSRKCNSNGGDITIEEFVKPLNNIIVSPSGYEIINSYLKCLYLNRKEFYGESYENFYHAYNEFRKKFNRDDFPTVENFY